MRNLYSKLGIKPSASKAEITSAIDSCRNAKIKDDATTVLLAENRRHSYDLINNSLTDIGTLRAALGLNHADNWQGEISAEYSLASGTPSSKHQMLFEKIKRSQPNKVSQKISTFFSNILWVAAAVFMIWIFADLDRKPSASDNQTSRPSKPIFNEPILSSPKNGAVRTFNTEARIAPFEIKTSSGSNYLIKLEDINTGNNVMDIFVLGGRTIEVNVPLGSYIVKYASGGSWYGYKHYFGEKTQYSKADSIFRFKKIGSQISGYTITLYQVSNGNLRTKKIKSENF